MSGLVRSCISLSPPIFVRLGRARSGLQNAWCWATSILAGDRRYSLADPDGEAPPMKPFPPVLLREFHYREADAEEKIRDVERRLTLALRASTERATAALAPV
jgi:uncharacterized protein YcbX